MDRENIMKYKQTEKTNKIKVYVQQQQQQQNKR